MSKIGQASWSCRSVLAGLNPQNSWEGWNRWGWATLLEHHIEEGNGGEESNTTTWEDQGVYYQGRGLLDDKVGPEMNPVIFLDVNTCDSDSDRKEEREWGRGKDMETRKEKAEGREENSGVRVEVDKCHRKPVLLQVWSGNVPIRTPEGFI